MSIHLFHQIRISLYRSHVVSHMSAHYTRSHCIRSHVVFEHTGPWSAHSINVDSCSYQSARPPQSRQHKVAQALPSPTNLENMSEQLSQQLLHVLSPLRTCLGQWVPKDLAKKKASTSSWSNTRQWTNDYFLKALPKTRLLLTYKFNASPDSVFWTWCRAQPSLGPGQTAARRKRRHGAR